MRSSCFFLTVPAHPPDVTPAARAPIAPTAHPIWALQPQTGQKTLPFHWSPPRKRGLPLGKRFYFAASRARPSAGLRLLPPTREEPGEGSPRPPPRPEPAPPRPSSLTHPCGERGKGSAPPCGPRPVPSPSAARSGGGGRAVPSPTWRPPPPEGCPPLKWRPLSAPCAPGARWL